MNVDIDDGDPSVVLDFGFGTIQIDGVSGNFNTIEDINDYLGYEAVELV